MAVDEVAFIPSVDISGFLADPTSPGVEKVIIQIRDACRTSGFFQITGHGISPVLRSAVLQAAKTFFSLPLEEKVKYAGVRGRGYEIIGSQALDPETKPDLKEGFFVGRDDPTRKAPFRNFEHPNLWPTPAVPDAEFKEPLLRYHTAMLRLSLQVMDILRRGLALPALNASVFDEFCTDAVASIRLLHYPPHPETADDRTVGTGAHTDFGAITLLLQFDGSGLQALNHTTQEWIDVPVNPEAYVVNVGDMLSYWTKNEYRSNIHRVINTSGTDRYSVPFFFDGNLDCELKPLDGSKGNGSTVSDHLNARYQDVYTLKK